MRFTLFGGLVIVVYTALAYARRFSAGCDGSCPPQGLEYAFVVSLEALAAVLIVSLGTALVRWLPSPRRNGPGLEGIVGRPVQEHNCGPMVVEEAHLPEALLNPSATVAVGSRPSCGRSPVS
jgi:hypothetical protein